MLSTVKKLANLDTAKPIDAKLNLLVEYYAIF
jgi:hypothetical protein